MIPVELRIRQFGSFSKQQVFRFPQEPGLYFMTGRNEAEPRLDANGTGKSTIWKALHWLIFGVTPQGLKAGDVSSWGIGKDTCVEFDFVAPSGEPCTLIRTWKPNSWVLQGTEHPELCEDLTKTKDNFFLGWLGLEAVPFLNAVLMAQGEPMFLDLKAGPQAELFSSVLGLDRWMEYSAKASRKAGDQDRVSRALERDLASIQGELEGLGREDLKSSLEAWERERVKRLEEVESQLLGYDAHSTAKADSEMAQEKERQAREEFRKAKEPFAGLDEALTCSQAEVQRLERDLDLLERDEEHAAAHMDSIVDGKACPSCGHLPSISESVDKQRQAKKKLDLLAQQINALFRQLQDAKAQAKQVRSDVDAAEALLEKRRKALDRAIDDASKARRELQQEERDIDRLEDRYDAIKAERNPYRDMVERERDRRKLLTDRLQSSQCELDDSNSKHGLYSYWVRGFKELRLQQIAEALTELEIEVNSSVEALGLVGWALKFQVDRETKGGGLSRGFSVSVWSPQNQLAVPWAAWSGGEAQRLRLAAQMGLSDLIRSRTGAAIPLEIWDEPTQGLSAQGIQDLLEALATRARTEQRQIWLVDHRAHAFGSFAGEATVIKTNSGSRIRQS